MNLWKFVAVSLILTISTGFATASPAEMSIFPQESSSEINSFTSYEITVENTGNVEDVYELQPDVDQVTVAPSEVRVQPGESETAHAWYNPDDTQEAKTYSFRVTATSRADGERYSVEGIVNVLTDHKVSLNTNQASNTVCRGETAYYNIQVTNDGIQSEEFKLSTPVGHLSQEKVDIQQGETDTVTVSVSSDEAVERNFNVVASSPTSYAEDTTRLNFVSETCYESETSIEPSSQEVGAYTESEYEVTVDNTGTKTDEFNLTTDKGELEEDIVTIEGGASETVTLSYAPEELGTEKISVKAEGESRSSATATAEVVNAMDLDIQLDRESNNVCENEEAVYTVEVENTGEAAEQYLIETNRGELSAEKGVLEAGESGELELDIDSSELETGQTYGVEVTGTATTFSEPVKTAESELKVENCYDLKMNVVPKVMSAGENRSVVYEIRLQNPGTRENTYNISYDGPKWLSIKPEEVTVASGERETAYMYAGIPFEKEGEFRINVTSEGNKVTRTDKVTLLVGEDIREAIRDDRNMLTGRFSQMASRLSDWIIETTDTQRAVLSIIVGLAITLAVLYRE